MAVQTRQPKLPSGFSRLMFRLPIYLYKVGLGGLLGGRFLLLNHVGRKSGQPRQAVVEVVRHVVRPTDVGADESFAMLNTPT